MAVKTCQNDGTWMKKDGVEWTDYTPCLTYEVCNMFGNVIKNQFKHCRLLYLDQVREVTFLFVSLELCI